MDSTPPDPALERLGMNVKLARVARRWTQEQLALDAGMTRANISKLERGLLNPSARTIIKVAKSLGVEPGQFFEGTTTL